MLIRGCPTNKRANVRKGHSPIFLEPLSVEVLSFFVSPGNSSFSRHVLPKDKRATCCSERFRICPLCPYLLTFAESQRLQRLSAAICFCNKRDCCRRRNCVLATLRKAWTRFIFPANFSGTPSSCNNFNPRYKSTSALQTTTLQVVWQVKNVDERDSWAMIGSHPSQQGNTHILLKNLPIP